MCSGTSKDPHKTCWCSPYSTSKILQLDFRPLISAPQLKDQNARQVWESNTMFIDGQISAPRYSLVGEAVAVTFRVSSETRLGPCELLISAHASEPSGNPEFVRKDDSVFLSSRLQLPVASLNAGESWTSEQLLTVQRGGQVREIECLYFGWYLLSHESSCFFWLCIARLVVGPHLSCSRWREGSSLPEPQYLLVELEIVVRKKVVIHMDWWHLI